MKINKFKTAMISYVIGALLTFGYSYNRDYDHSAPDLNAMRAYLCAMVWPAYVSKVAFEGLRP